MKIQKKTLKRLDKFKVHPRQSYDEVLNTLLKEVEDKIGGKEL